MATFFRDRSACLVVDTTYICTFRSQQALSLEAGETGGQGTKGEKEQHSLVCLSLSQSASRLLQPGTAKDCRYTVSQCEEPKERREGHINPGPLPLSAHARLSDPPDPVSASASNVACHGRVPGCPQASQRRCFVSVCLCVSHYLRYLGIVCGPAVPVVQRRDEKWG